jgi:hypothetical protein
MRVWFLLCARPTDFFLVAERLCAAAAQHSALRVYDNETCEIPLFAYISSRSENNKIAGP